MKTECVLWKFLGQLLGISKAAEKGPSLWFLRRVEQSTIMWEIAGPRLQFNLLLSRHKPHMAFFKSCLQKPRNPRSCLSAPGGACWQCGSTSLSKDHQARDRVQARVHCGTVRGSLWVLVPVPAGKHGWRPAGHSWILPTDPSLPLPSTFFFSSRKTPGRGEDIWQSSQCSHTLCQEVCFWGQA